MFTKYLKSKLHQAKVTSARLHYPGSIAIDSELLEAADIQPYETVVVADVDNGNRLETYAVPEKPGSGTIEILGAAAKLVKPGDTIIVFSFGYYSDEEKSKVKPRVIILDENNKIKEKK